jgi:hypothetical protein
MRGSLRINCEVFGVVTETSKIELPFLDYSAAQRQSNSISITQTSICIGLSRQNFVQSVDPARAVKTAKTPELSTNT